MSSEGPHPSWSGERRETGIARLRSFAFCPETLKEIGAELGLRLRMGLYRYPTPVPGEFFAKLA